MKIYFNEVKFSLFCIVFSQNGYRVGTAKKAFQCSYKKCVSHAVYRTPLWVR